jgi:hypothetical protein
MSRAVFAPETSSSAVWPNGRGNPKENVHLKPDPVAVEFLKQFGLAFLLVIFGAMWVMSYGSIGLFSKHKRSSKPRHKDEPKGDA